MSWLFFFVIVQTTVLALPTDNADSPIHSASTEAPSILSSTAPPCKNFHDVIPQFVFPVCNTSRGIQSLRSFVVNNMACTCDMDTYDIHKRSDYHYSLGGGAHKLHTTGATFNNARKICNEEGGHLAVIDSRLEKEILVQLFASAKNLRNVTNDQQAFIGIHDLFFEGDWVTILGDSLHKYGYVEWTSRWGGQPDNGEGVQHCGTLLKNGEMDDVNCNAQFAFFCEIPGVRIAH